MTSDDRAGYDVSGTQRLMPIGVFARITGLSHRALRLYADRGLLPPAFVDPETGYRSYDVHSIRAAEMIRLLRRSGVPLAEMRLYIDAAATDRLEETVTQQKKRLEQEQARLDAALRLLDRILKVCVPTFMTIAEDMSYNHGPMISKRTFDEFVAPYYRQLVPRLLEREIMPFVDTDGDVTLLVPWFEEVGVNGFLPLERQAGVDGMRLRGRYPRLRMIGHFDKMTMNKGEAAMRAEFDRLVPLMKTGGFIPSVDHQTPPGVSLEEYGVYLRLLREYMDRGHL